MIAEGTVVNGVIVLDGGVKFPEAPGCGSILPTPTRLPRRRGPTTAKELAILGEALEDVRAGRGTPVEEFMAQLAAEHKLPSVPAE